MRTENLESKILSTGKITYILFPPMLRLPFSLCFKCLIKLNWNKCPHRYWHKFKHLGFKSHPRLRCNFNTASVLLQTCQISRVEHEIHTFLQHHHLLCSQHSNFSPTDKATCGIQEMGPQSATETLFLCHDLEHTSYKAPLWKVLESFLQASKPCW